MKVIINFKQLSPKAVATVPPTIRRDVSRKINYGNRRALGSGTDRVLQDIRTFGIFGSLFLLTNFENDMILKKEGEIIHFKAQERHRLVGLDKIGVVAEIWIHTDLNNLSDENDIVRINDDFNRT